MIFENEENFSTLLEENFRIFLTEMDMRNFFYEENEVNWSEKKS
jgi:hypothetical protein